MDNYFCVSKSKGGTLRNPGVYVKPCKPGLAEKGPSGETPGGKRDFQVMVPRGISQPYVSFGEAGLTQEISSLTLAATLDDRVLLTGRVVGSSFSKQEL